MTVKRFSTYLLYATERRPLHGVHINLGRLGTLIFLR